MRKRTLIPSMLAVGVLAWLGLEPSDSSFNRSLLITAAPRPAATGAPILADPETAVSLQQVPFPFRIEPGQSLSVLLAGLGIDPVESQAIATSLADFVDLRRLKPGDPYTVYLDPAGGIAAFELGVEDRGEVRVSRTPDAWEPTWRPFDRRVEARRIEGVLEGTLEGAIRQSGGSPSLAYAMADALQWDLDFTRDLRVGDRFQVVYEQVFVDHRDRGPRQVLGLRYENRGRVYEAYRFGEDGGFYDAEGRPLKKMFLRSPLRFSRVTSQFSHRRFHPVLKVYRPHYGVDYGAPVGTPVRATASGTVVSAGWKGGGGRTVQLRHPNEYQTSYLHLSRIAPGLRPGRRVQQGEVIGYVGSSGLSTGPHLDYRVKHHGRWIDPLSIKSVPASPIAQRDLPQFIAWRDTLRSSLETGLAPSEVQLASAPSGIGAAEGDATAQEVDFDDLSTLAR